MQDHRKVGICLTVYNRPTMILESFRQVYNDPRVSGIYIVDDCSTPENYGAMVANLCKAGLGKAKVCRNSINHGVYDNKRRSVEFARNEMGEEEWVIVFDSDNILDTRYLDVLYNRPWVRDVALAPSFAKPHFDYRRFSGHVFRRDNAKHYCSDSLFGCLLNTMNYFCHRQTFLDTWIPCPGIAGADSIYFNKLWLERGNSIAVIPGLEYEHRIHNGELEHGSNYINFAKESEPLCNRELECIRNL